MPICSILCRNAKLCIIALLLPISLISQVQCTSQTENKSNQSGQAATNEPVDWQTYEDREQGYKIQYPQEWITDEPEGDIPKFLLLGKGITITPDDYPGTELSVDVKDATRTLDPAPLQVQLIPLEEYANEVIRGLTTRQWEPTVIKNEAITFNGEPAWRVDYIWNFMGSQALYGNYIFVIKDSKLYEIHFATPPLEVQEMRPIGEKIIQTFQFTNNTTNQLE